MAPPTVDDVAEPDITGPSDVIVRVGGAGLCRTDLHVRLMVAGYTRAWVRCLSLS